MPEAVIQVGPLVIVSTAQKSTTMVTTRINETKIHGGALTAAFPSAEPSLNISSPCRHLLVIDNAARCNMEHLYMALNQLR